MRVLGPCGTKRHASLERNATRLNETLDLLLRQHSGVHCDHVGSLDSLQTNAVVSREVEHALASTQPKNIGKVVDNGGEGDRHGLDVGEAE